MDQPSIFLQAVAVGPWVSPQAPGWWTRRGQLTVVIERPLSGDIWYFIVHLMVIYSYFYDIFLEFYFFSGDFMAFYSPFMVDVQFFIFPVVYCMLWSIYCLSNH